MDVVQELAAKDEVRDTIVALFSAIDRRDWARVLQGLSPAVLVDKPATGPGLATRMTAQELVHRWERALRPMTASHHQVGNFQVSVMPPEARATCHTIIYHHRVEAQGRSTRALVGTHELHLRRSEGAWRIDEFRFDLRFIDGNPDLENA